MPTNEFLPFAAAGGANVLPQADYAGSASRLAGVIAGTATSALANKSWRQSASMAAALGDTLVDAGYDALDDGDTKIIVTDNLDMSMTFGVAGKIPSLLFIVLLSRGYVPLKPEGVRADYLITTVDGPLFGWDVDNEYIAGWDDGAWGARPEYFTS